MSRRRRVGPASSSLVKRANLMTTVSHANYRQPEASNRGLTGSPCIIHRFSRFIGVWRKAASILLFSCPCLRNHLNPRSRTLTPIPITIIHFLLHLLILHAVQNCVLLLFLSLWIASLCSPLESALSLPVRFELLQPTPNLVIQYYFSKDQYSLARASGTVSGEVMNDDHRCVSRFGSHVKSHVIAVLVSIYRATLSFQKENVLGFKDKRLP